MSRSSKKGPAIDEKLVKKVEARTAPAVKRCSRLGRAGLLSFLRWSALLSEFMTDGGMSLFSSPKIWSDINWGSLP